MKTTAIIQARIGSTRLPGKVLEDICGRTMLERVIVRVRQTTLIDNVIVATSIEGRDKVIAAECDRLGVDCFHGSENDVLDRYYRCANVNRVETIVRITSDCPLIDPAVTDHVIREFYRLECDYASNTLQRSYPLGLDTEVFSLDALTKAWHNAEASYQRIHVTPYIYENPHLFRLHSVVNDTKTDHYRWTVDTAKDLELVRSLYSRIKDKDGFSWTDALREMKSAPYLAKINRSVRQKSLHEG